MEKRERNIAAGTDPVTPAQRRAWRLTYITAKPVMAHKYNFTCDQIGINGPFLLVSNHACNADPILIGLSSKDMPLTYVASEHLERMGAVTKLLTRYYSIIPRKKASSAADTVKSVLRALKRGAPVVLFAEGECTWDGVSAPVFPATGKLAKVSRVPLVTYRLEGNYLSMPRWADSSRRGRIRGRVVHRYSPEELARMSPDEITAAINRDIYEDAWETQRRDNVILASRKRAEGLERALFICPECGEIGGLQTKGDAIFCTKCGMRVTVDQRGFFRDGRFSTVREWDVWQREQFPRLTENPAHAELFPADGVLTDLSAGTKRKISFCLDLAGGAMVIGGEHIPLPDFSDMAMVKTNRLLFGWNGDYYEIVSKHGILRPYLLAKQLYSIEKGKE